MTNQSFHCFDFDSTGRPDYVRGLAQGYWYYSGPIAAQGQVSVLSIYANNPENHEYALVGTMRINYTSNFLSATDILVTCQPSSWCALWPTELVNGRSLDTNLYPTETYCLYQAGATPGSYSDMLSEWTSAQGTTWMCAAPTPTESMATNGSWNFINDQSECESRGETYPCYNNSGPYYNGLAVTLPNGAGLLVTQWYGWNFGTQNGNGVVDGRSLFAVPVQNYISGSYCVYNDTLGIIEYCYPEAYNIIGPSTTATCATFVNGPTAAPTSAPTFIRTSDSSSSNSSLSGDQVAIIILSIALASAIISFVYLFYLRKPKPPLSSNEVEVSKM
jgi:hypothetical protein